MEKQRYVVEIINPGKQHDHDYSDLDEAMIRFYSEVALNYREPSTEVAVHDLVAGRTLSAFAYEPNDDIGKVEYDTPTPVLGN